MTPELAKIKTKLLQGLKAKCVKRLRDGVANVMTSKSWETGTDQQGITPHFATGKFDATTGKFSNLEAPTEEKSCGVSAWSLKNHPWTDDGSG